MKKFLTIILAIFLALGISGCFSSKTQGLENYLSELRCQIYQGNSEQYKLKAYYGFKETPYQNDAKVNKKVYELCFMLFDKQSDSSEYSLSFNYNGVDYTKILALDPTSHTLTCSFAIENFSLTCFTISLINGSNLEQIEFSSIVPNNTISYLTALEKLCASQQNLVNSFYSDNGIFLAEIHERIIVKDGKPYWYIAFATGNDKL